jgi:protein-disulfide isomerase
VRLVFRHYPLDGRCNDQVAHGLHPMACLAAAAAECAGRQGRFWEYHDHLFRNQGALERESLFGFARDLALDLGAFRGCLDDPATMDRVRRDVELGAGLGVASTPTIFINGRRVDGALERHYYDYAITLETHPAPDPG